MRGRALVERLSKDSRSISKNNAGGIAGFLYTVRIMTGRNTNFISKINALSRLARFLL